MRPAVRYAVHTFGEVYVQTAWPQLYHDLPVRLLKPDRMMRTEEDNLKRVSTTVWSAPPPTAEILNMSYDIDRLSVQNTPLRSALRGVGAVNWESLPVDFSLPIKPEWRVRALERLRFLGVEPGSYSLVHPPTVRSEWINTARNPRHEYVQQTVLALPGPWISFAHLQEGKEWLAGPPLPTDWDFHRGELEIGELAALISLARVTVAAPSFVLPMVAAVRATGLILWGGYHPPEYCLDTSMLSEKLFIAAPLRPCACLNYHHECDRELDLGPVLNRLKAKTSSSHVAVAKDVADHQTEGSGGASQP
jgi:hypothetical protein